jgi:tripartite motif-containing protein 71
VFRTRVRLFSVFVLLAATAGVVQTTAAKAQPPRAALFKQVEGIALDARGNIWVVDYELAKVTELSPAGKVLARWGQMGTKCGQIIHPNDIAVGPDGGIWVSTASDTPCVEKFSPTGKLIEKRDHVSSVVGLSGRLTLDRAGDLWIALGGGVENIPDVIELSPSGQEITQWQAPHKKTTTQDGIAVDPRGAVYLSAGAVNRLYKFTTKGKFLGYVAKSGDKLGQVDNPQGLALDHAGNLYVVDQGFGAPIQEFSPSGKALRAFPSIYSGSPLAVAVSRKGIVYLGDAGGVHVYSAKGKQMAYWH